MKQRAVIGSAASKTVISMLTTVRMKEGQKTLKTLMLFIMSLTLPNPLKPTWKRSSGKSYPTRRIPNIMPFDYYLFRSMAHGLADQQFHLYEDIEKWLDSWIASKDEHFYSNGIRALPERWAKVEANDGKYFEWYICNHFFTIKLHFHKKNSGNLVAHLIATSENITV